MVRVHRPRHHLSARISPGIPLQFARHTHHHKQEEQTREALRSQNIQVHHRQLGIQLHRMPHLPVQADEHLHRTGLAVLLFDHGVLFFAVFHDHCEWLSERDDEDVFDHHWALVFSSKVH